MTSSARVSCPCSREGYTLEIAVHVVTEPWARVVVSRGGAWRKAFLDKGGSHVAQRELVTRNPRALRMLTTVEN